MADVAKPLPDEEAPEMTAEEFLNWPGDGSGRKFELVDGQLRAMSPASDAHGTVQARLTTAIQNRLDETDSTCRVVAEPAVAVRVRANVNRRVPDLGVTCTPNERGHVEIPDPVLLVEILSPGNKEKTFDNVWAYTTIPSLQEILVLSSWSIHGRLLRRLDDQSWPDEFTMLSSDDELTLASVDLSVPLKSLYRKTYLDK